MSGYTVGEIVVWLVLAAALGFVLGWLVRGITHRARPAVAPADAPPPLDVPAPPVDPGGFSRSAKPLADGAPPAPEWVVKGKTRSMIYHEPGSPAYQRTVAETWFRTAEDAEAAGFRRPRNAQARMSGHD